MPHRREKDIDGDTFEFSSSISYAIRSRKRNNSEEN